MSLQTDDVVRTGSAVVTLEDCGRFSGPGNGLGEESRQSLQQTR